MFLLPLVCFHILCSNDCVFFAVIVFSHCAIKSKEIITQSAEAFSDLVCQLERSFYIFVPQEILTVKLVRLRSTIGFLSYLKSSFNSFSLFPFRFWDDKQNKYDADKGNSGKEAWEGLDGVSEGGNHVGDGEGEESVEGGADGGRCPLEGDEGGGNVNPVQRSPHQQLPKPPQLTLPQTNLCANAKW